MRKPPPGDSGDTGTGHALDYLSPEYALFKADTLSPQEAATTQIPAEVLTIVEMWDILLVALPRHGRRFPLFGG